MSMHEELTDSINREIESLGSAIALSPTTVALAVQRHFSVDSLERYIEKQGDLTPIYYLIDRFLHEKTRKQEAAMAQLAPILAQIAPLMRQAGLSI